MARLRPITPGDTGRLSRFHDRLTAGSVYRRYHAPHPHLDEGELHFLTTVDQREHIAWVAVDETDEILGVCRVIGDPGGRTGEIAIVVADEAQHQGIGHALLARVLDEAKACGFRHVQALILASNTGARRLFDDVARRRGIGRRAHVSGGVIDLDLELDPAPARS